LGVYFIDRQQNALDYRRFEFSQKPRLRKEDAELDRRLGPSIPTMAGRWRSSGVSNSRPIGRNRPTPS
jgi:hypothetical protein